MRKLATVETILSIEPHINADRLELASVRGWQCVVKKGDFKVGDKVVFFEIDSFIPVSEEFEFLRPNCYKEHPTLGNGFRLRTIKLRGELSQGLIMPYSIMDKIEGSEFFEQEHDVTEILGVQKYEIPESGRHGNNLKFGKRSSNFPSFIQKTDEERIQNLFQKVEKYYPDHEWDVTEKLDGSSTTVAYYKNVIEDENSFNGVFVCSRNFQLKFDPENSDYVRAAVRQGLVDSLVELKLNIAIQGELCGPGIQGNKYKLTEKEIYIFNIWDIDERRYLVREEFEKVLAKIIEACPVEKRDLIKTVPYLGRMKLHDTLQECLTFADQKSKICPTQDREGVVFRSAISDKRLLVDSFKAISNTFLLNDKVYQ